MVFIMFMTFCVFDTGAHAKQPRANHSHGVRDFADRIVDRIVGQALKLLPFRHAHIQKTRPAVSRVTTNGMVVRLPFSIFHPGFPAPRSHLLRLRSMPHPKREDAHELPMDKENVSQAVEILRDKWGKFPVGKDAGNQDNVSHAVEQLRVSQAVDQRREEKQSRKTRKQQRKQAILAWETSKEKDRRQTRPKYAMASLVKERTKAKIEAQIVKSLVNITSLVNKTVVLETIDSGPVCYAACLAPACDLSKLAKNFLKAPEKCLSTRGGMKMELVEVYSDGEVLQLRLRDADGFVFPFGCFVCWGCTSYEFARAKSLLRPFMRLESEPFDEDQDSMEYVVEPLSFPQLDSLGELYADTTRREQSAERSVRNEKIYLTTSSDFEKLAHSYALAQSVKLGVFENMVDRSIEKTRKIPKTMAQKGSVEMSAKGIAMQMGELLSLRCDVNLNTDILDTPAIFWEEEEFEQHYAVCRSYLEVDKRVEILNTRLEVLRDLFDILQEAQNVRQGARLEWTVIILVGLEVLFAFASFVKDVVWFGVRNSA